MILPPIEERRARQAAREAAQPFAQAAKLAKRRAVYARDRAQIAVKDYDSAGTRHYRELAEVARDDCAQVYQESLAAARSAYLAHGGAGDADKRAEKAAYVYTLADHNRANLASARAYALEGEAYRKRSLTRCTWKVDKFGNLLIWKGDARPTASAKKNKAAYLQLSQEREAAYEDSDLTPAEIQALQFGWEQIAGLNEERLCCLLGIDY